MTTPGASIDQRYRAGQTLSAEAVCRALDRLQSEAETSGPAATVYLPADDRDAVITALAKEPQGLAWIQTLENAGSRVLRSETGIAAFRVGNVGLAILPGLPLSTNLVSGSIDDEPLRNLLATEYTVGVALLRLGRYAIAVYRGRELLVSKTDTRYVKGKHHAGGTSQRRFQRVREHQIHRLYVKASQVLTEQWRSYADKFDYVALGGEASTIDGFIKESNLLQRLTPITLARRLDVREPKRAALDEVGAMLYECRVYPLHWPD